MIELKIECIEIEILEIQIKQTNNKHDFICHYKKIF